ncbi:MAG: AGE family epimerase/isomerase [Myxococcota bacterium]
MFDRALPFWAHAGVDPTRGGFHEALTLRGRPAPGGFRRLRVTCRQVYTFSHASVLGWRDGLSLAGMGVGYLLSKGWLGPDAGFARRLTPRGAVLDPTPDLYDHAFVLFALGWWHRASGDPDALVWAHRTLDFLELHLRSPAGPGFLDARPAGRWRLQNPHMHLLEAALTLFESSGVARFGDLAREIARLFHARFFDERTGTIGEAFDARWERAPGEDGRRVEPGHHFEWAWLLSNCQRLLGERAGDVPGRLVAFAELHGVDPVHGFVRNAVRDDGVVLDGGSRTWPNTERLKAHVALLELDGRDTRAALADTTRVLLERYLARRPAGTWLDHFDADGALVADTVPAATFYHLFLAFSELLRVEPALVALARGEEHVPVSAADALERVRSVG